MTDEEIFALMPEDFQEIAEIVGIEKALKTSETLGGLVVSIPKLAVFRRAERDRAIRDGYDHKGLSVKQLAVKHSLTTRRIYDILGEKPPRQRR